MAPSTGIGSGERPATDKTGRDQAPPKTRVHETLKRQILTLELAPGADLDEVSLCARFDLSRTPLREVFRQLAGEGYITLQQNRGARVTDMSHTMLRGFFQTAPMIYAAVLRLAAQNAAPAQIADLKDAQVGFRAALRSGVVAERALANNRFHEITGEMAGNVYLTPSFQRLLIDHSRVSMTFFRPHDRRAEENFTKASQQHDAIIASIEAGDDDEAGRLAHEHWSLSRNQIEMFVMPDGLDEPVGSARRARFV
ncbi:GntR family transcriptional regulator [Oricola sp.]|uniref:GntR family transcriptional regulator n=1 Tax=Oricola sp. TaxID=1979950 RepID=UPI003BADACEB